MIIKPTCILMAFACVANLTFAQAKAPLPVSVNLIGKLVCLGCGGQFHSGSRSQCSISGQLGALKVTVLENGKNAIHYYTFLPSDVAKPLTDGESFHGKVLEVKGAVFPGSQVIDVESFNEIKATPPK